MLYHHLIIYKFPLQTKTAAIQFENNDEHLGGPKVSIQGDLDQLFESVGSNWHWRWIQTRISDIWKYWLKSTNLISNMYNTTQYQQKTVSW